MKIFDYKFLILLALTLVVYFIYREVEYLNSKVYKLENELKKYVQSNLLITDTVTKPVLSLPKNINSGQNEQVINTNASHELNKKNSNLESNSLLKDSLLSDSLLKDSLLKNSLLNDSLLKDNLSMDLTINFPTIMPKLINLDLTPSNDNITELKVDPVVIIKVDDVEANEANEESDSDTPSSQHLAIYSNDNELHDETQNSLLESVETNKNSLDFNYEIDNLKATVNEIIDSITSTSKSALEVNNENKYNAKSLELLKLPDIKKIAEELKIQLTKKVNGQQKIKNKHELIEEILSKSMEP